MLHPMRAGGRRVGALAQQRAAECSALLAHGNRRQFHVPYSPFHTGLQAAGTAECFLNGGQETAVRDPIFATVPDCVVDE